MMYNFLIVVLLVALLVMAPVANSQLPARPGSKAETTVIPDAPDIAAKAYILIDSATGYVIAEKNADEHLPPASLTKLMSSYIVVDEIEKGLISEADLVTVSIKAWKMGGSRMFIKEGTQVSVGELLRGVVIQSGNDATVALAEHIGGDEQAFVDMMNKKAAELGMTQTRFADASGMPAENHFTTARDLSKIARAIVNDHPSHYRLYSEKSYTFNGIRQPNRNLLLQRDASVDGLKTGHTEEAGYCLVASAKRENTRLVAVVLGTKSDEVRATESQKLLNYGFRYYETLGLYEGNPVVTKAHVWGGKQSEVNLGVPHSVTVTIFRGSSGSISGSVQRDEIITAPVVKGKEYGTLSIRLNGVEIAKEVLVAQEAVEQASFFQRLLDKITLFFRSMFGGELSGSQSPSVAR